jgi:hypothetical protein
VVRIGVRDRGHLAFQRANLRRNEKSIGKTKMRNRTSRVSLATSLLRHGNRGTVNGYKDVKGYLALLLDGDFGVRFDGHITMVTRSYLPVAPE